MQLSGMRARAAVISVAFIALSACSGAEPSSSAAAPATAASGTASASTAAGAPIRKIGVSWPNSANQSSVQVIIKAAKNKATAMGWEVVVDDPGSDQNKQLNTLNAWVEQGFPSMIVIALDPGPFQNVVADWRSKGTRIITYGAPLTGEAGSVAINNVPGGTVLGKLAGDWINNSLKQEAKVAILGFSTAQWGKDRQQGIIDGLDSLGAKYKIVAEQDATSETQGIDKMGAILQANPDVNAILSVEESATEGAYQALLNAGKDKGDPSIFVGGINGGLRALQLIKEGDTMYRGSAAMGLVGIGEGMVEKAIDLANGGPEPAIYDVQYTGLKPGDPQVDQFLSAIQP